MITALRIVLMVLLAALLVGALAGIFTSSTGILEKLVFAAAGAAVLVAAPRVQRLGRHPAA